MNAHGFGACANGPSYTFWPARHACAAFVREAADKLVKRTAWLAARGVV